ncbi:SusC/RagA family TonB-linked outer membrane protein [Pedobacter steynii]
MKLIIVIMTTCLMQVSAASFGQKVTIVRDNIALTEIFKEIRKQTGYNVLWQPDKINTTVKLNLKVKDEDLDKVLDLVLKNRNLTYSIADKTIRIKYEESTFLERLVDRWAAIDVHGRVVDSLGYGLAGASVGVKGSSLTTSTGANGSFQLKGVEEGATLVITYIGYITREVVVNKEFNLIVLKQSSSKLDEVQVIAYGTTTQRLSTGNVSTVKAADIEKAPVANPLLAIAGRVPGVFIQQSSGMPGSGVKILIQGQNSIGYGNDPFYVIDGVPYTSQLLPGLTNELGQSGAGTPITPPTNGNPLNFINPQDIESIDILKDADATSIYGSRAANGAIIITTKKGKAGRTAVNFNVQQGWARVTRKLDLMNTEQYLEMRKEAYRNADIPIPTALTPGAYDLTFWNQSRYTDWQKELIGGTAKYTNAMASISGGTGNTSFLVNAGYQQEGTVTPGDLRDRKASLHFNLNNTSGNGRFKFNLSSTYVADDNKLAAVSSMVNAAYTLPPNAPALYNSDGSLNWELLPNGVNSFQNPLTNLYYGYINRVNNLITNTKLSYEIAPGLELKSSLGYNKLQSEEITTRKNNQLSAFQKTFIQRESQFNFAQITSWIIEPQLIYVRQLGGGKLDFLLGTTIQQEDRDRQKLLASGFISDNTMTNIKAASSVRIDQIESNAVILSTYKYNAGFLRMAYNYKDKYLLNASARRDGSSRFGKENRFHNFASIAGAWIFSNEKMLKDNLKFLSFGKLKASYGTTGSDQIGDYGYLNLYSNSLGIDVPYQAITSLQPSGDFPNPYLQWEETRKFSAALDLGFFNDRILINTTYYRNRTGNQLLYESLVSITGGSGLRTNLPAKVQNIGIELGVSIRAIESKNFTWTSNFNFTQARNKRFDYNGVDGAFNELDGKAIGAFKVYHYLGVDQQTGLYTIAGQNGQPTSNPNPDTDRTVFIDLNPSFYGGLQNSIKYKNVNLDFLCQFVKQKAAGKYFGSGPPGLGAVNQSVGVLNRWQQQGDQAELQKYTTSVDIFNTFGIAEQSDRNYTDASYLRLKNVSLSWNLLSQWLTKAKFQSIRLYVQGQNLLTITNYPGVDPENRIFTALPPLKTLTLGVQLGI